MFIGALDNPPSTTLPPLGMFHAALTKVVRDDSAPQICNKMSEFTG